MRYRISHLTRYRYEAPVPASQNEVRLCPINTLRQTCHSFELTISPEPDEITLRQDYFGNSVHAFTLQEPHTTLSIEAQSEVEVFPLLPPVLEETLAWQTIPERLRTVQVPEYIDAMQYTFDSPFAIAPAGAKAFGREIFISDRPIMECCMQLMQKIYKTISYDKTATTVNTSVQEVLKARAGVCQDFAHLAIAVLRSYGLPARYVSGYLETKPPPDKQRLVGNDESHAWFAVFFPGYGWVDFDPTNNVLPSLQHLTIAWGRDYGDISPIKGLVLGGGRQQVEVAVDVIPL